LLQERVLDELRRNRETSHKSGSQLAKLSQSDWIAENLSLLQQELVEQVASLRVIAGSQTELLETLQSALLDEGLDVAIDANRGIVTLRTKGLEFEASKTDLADDARTQIRQIAKALATVLPRFTACRQTSTVIQCRKTASARIETVFIEGHADRTGSDAANWKISADRAVSAYQEMMAIAPELKTMLNGSGREVLSVAGYGGTRPLDIANNINAHAKNRRIDLRIILSTDSSENMDTIARLLDRAQREVDRLREAAQTPSIEQLTALEQ
jgi:chemotaxis protein MotB